MPIQYVDGHPTIAVDVANDRLKVNDATLEQKVNDLNTKIDALNTKIDTMQDGSYPVSTQLTGSILVEQLTNSDAVSNILTFSEPITSIEIYHEEITWQEFIINGITMSIPGGGYRTPVGGTPSAEVTIPAISCSVGRLV